MDKIEISNVDHLSTPSESTRPNTDISNIDIIGKLYSRGLDMLVEKVLADTDGQTVISCFQVCSSWEKHLWEGYIWRRIVEQKFAKDLNFRMLCRLHGWNRNLPSEGGREAPENEYKHIFYKATHFADNWTKILGALKTHCGWGWSIENGNRRRKG